MSFFSLHFSFYCFSHIVNTFKIVYTNLLTKYYDALRCPTITVGIVHPCLLSGVIPIYMSYRSVLGVDRLCLWMVYSGFTDT